GTVLSQQAERLLLPFAFWLVFYAFYNLIKASYFGYAESYLSELNNPTAWFGYILLGEIKYHMHFIPTLFPILLAYPLFQLAQRYPILGLTILVSLLAKREVDVFLWSNHQNLPGFEFALRAIKVACYLGYGMAAGALWGLYQRGRLTWCFRLSVGLVLVALVAKLEHARRIAMSGTWEWNFEPAFWADFLTPVGLFALAMSAPKGIWPELLVRLAPFSFGLYLMHPIFLDLAEIAISTLGLSPSAQVLAKILPTVLLTSVALYLVARTQALAWTIGLGPSPLRWRAHIGDRLGNIGQGR
ncbi:MAG: acyltransferase, partial [Pseudomonadota bacterium]